jgi:hypothetical protein
MLKVKIRVNHWLPKLLGADATTIYPWILIAGQLTAEPADQILLQHEFVHIRQVRAIGWLTFYASYFWQYLKLRLQKKDHDTAYREISFEAEAYAKQSDTPLSADELAEVNRT